MATWTGGCTESASTEDCVQYLLLTQDGGRSFSKVAGYVVQFSWGDKNDVTADIIYYTYHRSQKGSQPRHTGWSIDIDCVSSTNFGRTIKTLITGGNKFLVSNGYIFIAKLVDAAKQTVCLMVSTDKGDTFTAAQLPGDVDEKAYTILDTSEGAIMLHANHGDSGMGNVYISDAKGIRFSLSLPNNVRTTGGECEFDKVASLDGVYLANFSETTEPIQVDDEPTVVTRATHRHKAEEVVKTVVTFDKGGMWSYLKPPRVDSRGNQITCALDSSKSGKSQECHLHLHGITNFKQFAPVYSVENAVGLIMGTGNVGTHLRYEPDEINTYISNDGGLTWVEAHKGAFIYEFGDHGGLTVMADDLKKTKQIVFSWNEGRSWFDFDLSSTPIDVDNIVIEPNSSAVEFLVYGTRDNTGIIYHLDFAALGQPACRGVWAADSVSSDYETWSPSAGRSNGDRCLLGKQTVYTRRKQSSECYNGKEFQRPKQSTPCACTPEDYECDIGFSRKVGALECKPTDIIPAPDSCPVVGYFMATAYRKVPGDVCEGGYIPSQVAVPCPNGGALPKPAYWLFAAVICAFVLTVIAVLAKSPRIKRAVASLGFPSNSYLPLGKSIDDSPHRARFQDQLGFIDSDNASEDEAPSLMNMKPPMDTTGATNLSPRASRPDHNLVVSRSTVHGRGINSQTSLRTSPKNGMELL